MVGEFGRSQKNMRKSKLIVRLLIPMLLLVMLQLVIFFAVLIISGEFTYVREYAYDTLVEKTENRKNYIQTEFQQKVPFVRDAAQKMEESIAAIIAERHASIGDIQTDTELDRVIMENAVDPLIDLLRRSTANDVYLILDTGGLYDPESGAAKACLYLRDLDTMTDAGYEDLLMEVGFSSISRDLGITMDSGWTLHFTPDPNDSDNYGYYFDTMQTATENPTAARDHLGHWSAFSRISRGTVASMKYTVPLIAKDGTVYGVMGIGLTENTLLSKIPSNDFMSETACYVLGHNKAGESRFDIITHSGAAFSKLVGNSKTLDIGRELDENVRDVDIESTLDLAGNVQYIELYNPDSPYSFERWALISVADRASVLRPMNVLIQMLIIAASVSFAISIFVVFFIAREVVKPITEAIKTMNTKREYSQVIRFHPSNIYELDKMTDAITELQINVQDYSSQVSQMIRIADVGLGTFMYNREDDSVFVGQSLFKLLSFETEHNEDVMMNREEFLSSIIEPETQRAVSDSLEHYLNDAQEDYVKEFSIEREDGSRLWLRLSLVNNNNKSIGIMQDITNVILEKQRIEYERDYDGTTGLLNRKAYYREIEKLFLETDLKVAAFVMLDLDNLKYVNDTYGHDFGDDYIKTAATALKEFRKCGGVVSRLSGDEFSICLSGFNSKDEVRGIIDRVRGIMDSSYCLLSDGTHFKIRASAGISWYPDDADTYEMLMKYSDFAMYTVKHSTKGGIAEFDMSEYNKDSVLITGVEEMNRIIDECSVRYAFHSIVDARTGEIYGYEALMRPQSTVLQSPMDLLRIAKTGARLYEIERLTWTRAFADFQAQVDAGRIPSGAHIFINSISNCSLKPSDADEIEVRYPDLLSKVVLEVLEGESSNEEYTSRKIKRMKKWDAQIALDDFGTGYNSEYALITLQPNIIKIDRSIISGCDKDISRRTIITNLIKLVRAKNIMVLAEGVETEDELKTVIACGVDLIQGYLVNRPVFEPEPLSEEVVKMIKSYGAQ